MNCTKDVNTMLKWLWDRHVVQAVHILAFHKENEPKVAISDLDHMDVETMITCAMYRKIVKNVQHVKNLDNLKIMVEPDELMYHIMPHYRELVLQALKVKLVEHLNDLDDQRFG